LESEYSCSLKTRRLLKNKDAKNAQTSKIGPNWNVSGTWDFHPSHLFFNTWTKDLWQQPKNGYARCCPDVYTALRNGGRHELVPIPEVVARTRHISVIELMGNVGGLVSIEHRGAAVVIAPDDAVARRLRQHGLR
jgi:hypothetical protein